MDGHHQHELTPGQQVLSNISVSGPERTYAMTSTDKHKVTRGEFRVVQSDDASGPHHRSTMPLPLHRSLPH